ncbi:hypothetical protein Tco_1000803, partial [Tanacetum coccineum]
VSAGWSMVLLVVILPAASLVSAGSSMFLLVVIPPAASLVFYVSAASCTLFLLTLSFLLDALFLLVAMDYAADFVYILVGILLLVDSFLLIGCMFLLSAWLSLITYELKEQQGTHLVGRTSALRDLILRFRQGDDEPIKSAWIRFQGLIKQVPHHEIQKWLLDQIFHDNISEIDRKKLDQSTQFRFSSLTEEEGWNRIEEYVRYQDDLWDEPSPSMIVSSISEAGDIYDDPSLIRFYQNDDTSPWGNNKCKEKKEDDPD